MAFLIVCRTGPPKKSLKHLVNPVFEFPTIDDTFEFSYSRFPNSNLHAPTRIDSFLLGELRRDALASASRALHGCFLRVRCSDRTTALLRLPVNGCIIGPGAIIRFVRGVRVDEIQEGLNLASFNERDVPTRYIVDVRRRR